MTFAWLVVVTVLEDDELVSDPVVDSVLLEEVEDILTVDELVDEVLIVAEVVEVSVCVPEVLDVVNVEVEDLVDEDELVDDLLFVVEVVEVSVCVPEVLDVVNVEDLVDEDELVDDVLIIADEVEVSVCVLAVLDVIVIDGPAAQASRSAASIAEVYKTTFRIAPFPWKLVGLLCARPISTLRVDWPLKPFEVPLVPTSAPSTYRRCVWLLAS